MAFCNINPRIGVKRGALDLHQATISQRPRRDVDAAEVVEARLTSRHDADVVEAQLTSRHDADVADVGEVGETSQLQNIIKQHELNQLTEPIAGRVFQIGQSRKIELTLSSDKTYITIKKYHSPEERLRNNTNEEASIIALDREQVRGILAKENTLRRYADRLLLGRPKDFMIALGRSVYVVGESNGFVLHIRRYWQPANEKRHPTKCGVSLRSTEFLSFLSLLPEIESVMLEEESSCSDEDSD